MISERDVMYNAFFDELVQLEKRAMMQKLAAANPLGYGARLAKGLSNLGSKSGRGGFWNEIGSAYSKASKKPKDMGRIGRTMEGVKGALRTPAGTVLGTGLGAAGAVALGSGAVGYQAGRGAQARQMARGY